MDASIVESSRRLHKVKVVAEREESGEEDSRYEVTTTHFDDTDARWTNMVFADKGYASAENCCGLEEQSLSGNILYKTAKG